MRLISQLGLLVFGLGVGAGGTLGAWNAWSTLRHSAEFSGVVRGIDHQKVSKSLRFASEAVVEYSDQGNARRLAELWTSNQGFVHMRTGDSVPLLAADAAPGTVLLRAQVKDDLVTSLFIAMVGWVFTAILLAIFWDERKRKLRLAAA